MSKSVIDFGASGEDNPALAHGNTEAFTLGLAKGMSELIVPNGVYHLINGQLPLAEGCTRLVGEGGMGANGNGYSGTTLFGHGPGDLLRMTGMGGKVEGFGFQAEGQSGDDCMIRITSGQGQCRVSDCHFYNPFQGIKVDVPDYATGEYWFDRILMEGQFGVAGLVANAGNATVHCSHVVMSSIGKQPFYGIAVTSCGELIIDNGCDIIGMGSCLALIPGEKQYVLGVHISNSLFDSPAGLGAILMQPKGGRVGTVRISNVWTSTEPGQRDWLASGFHLDGSGGEIGDVSISNSFAQNFARHAGLYATGVDSLTCTGSAFGGAYAGAWIGPNCPKLIFANNRCGPFGRTAGNGAWGLRIDENHGFIAFPNNCRGNGGSIYIDPRCIDFIASPNLV